MPSTKSSAKESPVDRLIEDLHRDRMQAKREVRAGIVGQRGLFPPMLPASDLGPDQPALQRALIRSSAMPRIRDGASLLRAFYAAKAGDERPLIDLLGLRTGHREQRGVKADESRNLTIARAAEALQMGGLSKNKVGRLMHEIGMTVEVLTPTQLDRAIAASRQQLDREYATEVEARLSKHDPDGLDHRRTDTD